MVGPAGAQRSEADVADKPKPASTLGLVLYFCRDHYLDVTLRKHAEVGPTNSVR